MRWAGVDWLVQAFRGRAGLSGVEDAWQMIFRTVERPAFYHLFEWHESYLRSLEKWPDDLNYYLISKSGRPVAIVPLRSAIRTIMGVRVKTLELPYHAHMPLTDVLCSKADTALPLIAVLARALAEEGIAWDLLAFPRILEHSSAASLLADAGSRCVIVGTNSHCNYLDCGPYNVTLQRFSRKFRNNLRTARNKLAALEGSYSSAGGSQADLDSAFEEFLRIEASGWKGSRGTNSAILLQEDVLAFYRGLVSGIGVKGMIEIKLLKVGSESVAALFSINLSGTFYLLKIGYREDFARLSPGHLLMEHTFRELGDSARVKEINFITNPRWLGPWVPRTYPALEGFFCNRTPRGLLVLELLRGKRRLRPVFHLVRSALKPAGEARQEKRTADQSGEEIAALGLDAGAGLGVRRGSESGQAARPLLRRIGDLGPDIMRAVWMSLRSPSVTIFMVHGLIDEAARNPWRPLRTYHSIQALEQSLRILKQLFHFVPLATAADMISRRRPLAKNTAVLTFDDGYRSVLKVMGFLGREDIVPTVFVATGLVGTSRLYWWDRLDYVLQLAELEGREIQVGRLKLVVRARSREFLVRSIKDLINQAKRVYGVHLTKEMETLVSSLEMRCGRNLAADPDASGLAGVLSWDEIKLLSSGGATIGSHTMDHLRLPFEDVQTVRKQLSQSKAAVEAQVGRPCEFLAYPSGDFTKETVRIASECGYRAAVTTVEGRNPLRGDLMRLKRISLPRGPVEV